MVILVLNRGLSDDEGTNSSIINPILLSAWVDYEADRNLFSMAFEEASNGVDLHLGWGKVRVKVPFTK